jgi:hypothetical protein
VKPNRAGHLFILALCLSFFVYAALALAEAGGSACHWAFPKWFGCVLSTHETLAAGLIGAAGALLAAWIAWTAVQQQISEERERMTADRKEAERLLEEDLSDYAEGMAAAWRLLVDFPEQPSEEGRREAIRQATAYMAERLSRADQLANYRAMAEILGWDTRRKYVALIRGLENLARFSDAGAVKESEEVLRVIRKLADDFEYCLPQTSEYFAGLWRRSPKAMTFADFIRYIGGLQY